MTGIISVAMVLCTMAIPAFANNEGTNGSVTVSGVKIAKGKTYSTMQTTKKCSNIRKDIIMITVNLAELNIRIDNKYPYIIHMCEEYISNKPYDFSIAATDAEISAEGGDGFDRGYLESLAIYRKIAEKILEYNGFLMHGVVVDVCGTGIAFLAKSGVGKSTHVQLWKRLLKDNVKIINGDKPLIRLIDKKIYACGTPWAGKENLHMKAKTELDKICFIERSENNECLPLEKKEVLERLMNQIYIPKNPQLLIKTLELAEKLIESADFYLIRCNTDISAAETAYEVVCK